MRGNRIYVSRSTARAWSKEHPIGDPTGGPAYGEKLDLGSVFSAGASIVGGIFGAEEQSDAAASASSAQIQAAQMSVEEQRRQFDALQKLLAPYVSAGTGAIGAQQNLLGLSGPVKQQEAISALESSPQMQALLSQGENAILQNASATGNLRGGNVQSALAQFRPQLLSQLIQQQYSNLGGLTSVGQNAAAGVGNAGMASATNISNLLQQSGAAQAGAALAAGKANANLYSGLAGTVGNLAGKIDWGSVF